ncbi:MFS transporter [Verrucomicrobiota bacterium]|nr:MFS transporter [Verrucomicrobiota bacterium]
MSVFFFSYALCQIPTAQLSQRWGSRAALPIFMVISSIATALTAFSGSLWALTITRGFKGIGQAGLFPACTMTIAKWFPKTGRGFGTGALGGFMSVGGAVGAWLTGVMLERLEPAVGRGWSWRLVFLVFSLPGLLWAAGFWAWFRNEPGQHKSVNAAEFDLIRGTTETPPAAAAPAPTAAPVAADVRRRTPWLALYSSPALWWICGQQTFRAAGYMFFTSWFATYLQETRGVTIARSGLLTMLPLLATVIGSLLGGATSDLILKRTHSLNLARKGMAVVCQTLCAALIGAAFFIQETNLAVLVISLGSFCAALAGPCAYTITIDMGREHVATVNSTMNMCGNLGAWAFPIAVPVLLRQFGNWDAVLIVFGGTYLVSAAFWLILNPNGNILDQSLIREAPAGIGKPRMDTDKHG